MAKYVDSEVIKEKLSRTLCLYEDLPALIDSIPAADVRPVVRGRWIKYYPHNSDMLTCSECEKYWILDGDQYDFHFCPNCGAWMEEE